jgi:cyclase
VNRREIFKYAAAAVLSRPLWAQQAGKIFVTGGGDGSNIVAFSLTDGFVLVDSGTRELPVLSPTANIKTLFNTHYHLDQTGGNERFGRGAKIIAHEHTRQWMSTDYWVPSEDRYEKARHKSAWPTETFQTTGSMKADSEHIDYGHLPLAHTDGDIYVFFKNSNVLAVGDVASPLRDPALDWFTGAWIGGRVDAMDTILKISNEETKIVPAYGPVMTRAEFKAERDMMEEVRSRIWKQALQGDGPQDMVDAGVLKGLPRTWKDPYKFLYDANKGMLAHHNKLDPAVI